MPAGVKIWSLHRPISDRLITPETRPPRAAKAPGVAVWGAPGQYLPASFVIQSPRDLGSVRISATSLRNGRHRIAADAVDLRVVKCWYMSGLGVWADPKGGESLEFDVTSIGSREDRARDNPGIDGCGYILNRDQLWLAPELLMKDDELIDYDRKRQDNVFRFTGMPTEPDQMQPIHLRARESKQLWITIHVPDETAPGRYTGQITVRIPKRASIEIPVTVDVLPIELSEPALDYMMYYSGFLTTRWGHFNKPHFRTPKQMLAELRDLKAHGVTNFDVSEWIDGDRPDGKHFDFRHIDRVMDLREEAGFSVRKLPLFWMGGPNMLSEFYKYDPWVIDAQRLKQIEKTTTALMRWARKRRIPDVYIYGVDEVQDAKLKQEIRAIKLIRRLGAKIMMAVKPNFHDYLGDLISCANVQGDPHDPKQIAPRVIKRMHRHGGVIYNYARPQTGECRPHAYRRNYGIDLYLSEMDGPWPYGYMAISGRYQGYDRIHTTHGPWLNHPFSYPTTDGVIPTWGSQGWRAAVDDVRYATTLQKQVDAGEGSKQTRSKAKQFLSQLSSDVDLEAQRRKCARHIQSLRQTRS